jgi:hypothetical protein
MPRRDGWGKAIDDRPRLVGQSPDGQKSRYFMTCTKLLMIISRQHLSVKVKID